MASSIPFTTRTCCKCGREFPQFQGERVCEICRKPRESAPSRAPRRLTPRERQICELIAQAKGDKEIAWALKLAEGTIKVYEQRMLDALGPKLLARNRVAVAVWWVTEGRAEHAALKAPEAA